MTKRRSGRIGPFKIIAQENVPVPMRDGTILRANVYRPDARGRFPVLVMRTPYGKGRSRDELVQAGYIVVTQDVRGRYQSDGEFRSLANPNNFEAEDGYDTVEWAARLPGSNGIVGTYGASYNAWVQWKLAALRPPSLRAMFAYSIPVRMTQLEGPGTIRPGRRLHWWICTLGPDLRKRAGGPEPHTPQEAREAWLQVDREKWLWFLPWLELPDYLFGRNAHEFKGWLRNPSFDPWQFDKLHPEIEVPNFHISGWYDHCNGCLDHFTGMVRNGRTSLARENQKLIIGPWGHSTLGQQKVGEIDFGAAARLNIPALMVRWFDYWLKGIDNGIADEPPVKYFVMGANYWRCSDTWPPAPKGTLSLYLTSGGHANTPRGDGKLLRTAPKNQSRDEYTYDPRDPVMTLYGHPLFTIPADQRPLASRRDILVYQTAPLKKDVEIAGYPEVVLYASSSAPDTDFFARLIDVAPDGTGIDICMGMVRARYRHSLDKPSLLKPNKVTEFVIKLGPTANRFKVGHRIRLDITSSDFPNYDRNHNTGLDDNADATLAVARQRVFHGGKYPSRLVLPLIS